MRVHAPGQRPVTAAREPVSKFFRTSDGVRLHYIEAGDGRTLIFVPGWVIPAEIWLVQLAYFSRNYRVVLPDPRSQGRSEPAQSGNSTERRAQDIAELIAHLGPEPVVCVGWSMGATEILSCVDRFGSDLMSGLVLVDVFIVQPEWMEQEVRRMSLDLLRDRTGAIDRYVRGMFRTPQEEGYITWLVNACLGTPADTAVALMEDFLRQPDWRPVLRRLNRPLLYAAQEGLRGEAHLLRENLPGAQVEIFEAAGHALFVEEADRFNDLLERFINGRSDRRPVAAGTR